MCELIFISLTSYLPIINILYLSYLDRLHRQKDRKKVNIDKDGQISYGMFRVGRYKANKIDR